MFFQVNTRQENSLVVEMAEKATPSVSDPSDPEGWHRDYWMGGLKLETGTWAWLGGEPMDYSNWCSGCADPKPYDYLQLSKVSYVNTFETFYWVPITLAIGDNGAICEMKHL